MVFVAMGSPKQELLMEEIQKKHKAIFQGLGGSFDVYTGHVERAPNGGLTTTWSSYTDLSENRSVSNDKSIC